jgi:hypothetical protein
MERRKHCMHIVPGTHGHMQRSPKGLRCDPPLSLQERRGFNGYAVRFYCGAARKASSDISTSHALRLSEAYALPIRRRKGACRTYLAGELGGGAVLVGGVVVHQDLPVSTGGQRCAMTAVIRFGSDRVHH